MNDLHHLQIRPATVLNIDELICRAKEDDGHVVAQATDVVYKNGKIVGYLSVAAVPTVVIWMHSKDASARDTFTAGCFAEATLARQGCQSMFLPVCKMDAYSEMLQKAGYLPTSFTGMMVKNLIEK